MKPNLLIVVDERKMGGVSILLEDMIELNIFSDYNTDILVLHNNGTRLEQLEDKVNIIYGSKYFDGVDITIKEAFKSKKISLIFRKCLLVFEMKTGLIKKRIKKERKKTLTKHYDIELAFKDGFTAIFTAFGDSNKKIHWLHYEYGENNPNNKYNKLFKEVIPKFDNFVAVSEGVKQAFTEFYTVNNITVIPNIVNANKIITKAKEKPQIVYSEDKINVVLVGRIHQVKAYTRFLEVVSLLKKEGLSNKLVINVIGDGPDMNNVLELNERYELGVKFWGKMDNPYKEIKNSDLLVLPSKYEAFGLVVLESMILHVPALATKTAATESIIKNDVNGIIVENSAEGLFDGLKNLIIHPEKLVDLKKNLDNYEYDIENIIVKIKQVLKEN